MQFTVLQMQAVSMLPPNCIEIVLLMQCIVVCVYRAERRLQRQPIVVWGRDCPGQRVNPT